MRARAFLEEASGWLVAQMRGNNDVSDDKCVHIVCGLLENHYGIQRPISPGAHARVNFHFQRAGFYGRIGRALIWGCAVLVTDQHEYEDDAWAAVNLAERLGD